MAGAGSQNGSIKTVRQRGDVGVSIVERQRIGYLLHIDISCAKPLQQGLGTRQSRQCDGIVVPAINLVNIDAFARQPLTPRQIPPPGHKGKGVIVFAVDLVDINAEPLKRLHQLKKARLSGQGKGVVATDNSLVDIDVQVAQPQGQRFIAGGSERQDAAADIVNQPDIGTVLHQQFDGFTVALACSDQ